MHLTKQALSFSNTTFSPNYKVKTVLKYIQCILKSSVFTKQKHSFSVKERQNVEKKCIFRFIPIDIGTFIQPKTAKKKCQSVMLQQLYKQMAVNSIYRSCVTHNEWVLHTFLYVCVCPNRYQPSFFFFVSMVLKVWHHRKCGSTYLCWQLNRHMSHYSRKTNT